jgi:nitrogen fixation protein FixH
MTLIDTTHGPAAKERSLRPLTGRKVFALLVAFFGVIASVDGVMIYLAVTTFRGEEVAHAYDRGLAYNREIAKARDFAARGWKVGVSIERLTSGEAHVSIHARDRSGADISGAAFSATLASPADKNKDVFLHLNETAPGHYEGSAQVEAGGRDLVLVAEQGGREMFRSKNRIRID